MYRIRLIYDVPGWAYWRRCQGIAKYAPDDFTVDVGRGFPGIDEDAWPAGGYDLILNLMPDQSSLRETLRRRLDNPIIVGGLNVGYGHHEERLRMCQSGADHIVVNNRDCYERLGKDPPTWSPRGFDCKSYATRPVDNRRLDGMTWISNGVDLDTFRVKVPIEDRKPRVLWCGSNYHCEHTNIKGWKEILLPLAERLEAAGIDYDYRRVESDKPKSCFSTEEMVDWYNTGTVYVCASSSEGTPNPALEAAACGCTLVSTRVGNMPELIRHGYNGLLVRRDAGAMADAIQTAMNWLPGCLAGTMQRNIQAWDWKFRAPQYYDLFRRLIRERRVGSVN
jgi:glycosyltransferase involved in cell wall biosynthesis